MTSSAAASEPPAVAFGRDVCRHPALSDGREWLVTNGLGSYASASVSGALTRSYHGLLVAAIAPPGDRRLLLSHLDAVDGGRENSTGIAGPFTSRVEPWCIDRFQRLWLSGNPQG